MTGDRILYGDPSWVRERPEARPAPGDRPTHVGLDAERLGQGLGQLVVAILELLRELLERQAIHRMEGGSLSDDEVERLGRALQALKQQLGELRDTFDVRDDDLDPLVGQVRDLIGPEHDWGHLK